MGPLNNKTVLITGASSGIGAACAKECAKHGANLILTARRQVKLEELKNSIQDHYPKCKVECFSLDVQNEQAIKTFFDHLSPDWQSIDILINNAGLAMGFCALQNGNPTDWNTMIDTNIKGLLFMSRYCLDIMIKHDRGHIINIGSIAGHEVYPNGVVYAATKHAVLAITKGLRMDLFSHQIRITAIDPGAVHTDFSLVRFHGDETRADQVYANWQPLTAEDVADAVVYAATRPPHVNVSDLVLMPTAQASVQMIHKNKI